MNQYFPNTSLIHGSVDGGIGSSLTQNISWQYNENPWSYLGAPPSDNQTHLGCLTNNATLQQVCCRTLGGSIVEKSGNVVDNATASNGGALWCSLPETGYYPDHYTSAPALVNSWAQCYNSSVTSANNPGIYINAITPSSDVWQCELRGNFSGSNRFSYPSYGSQPNSASSSQVGRFSLLAVAGAVAVATLSASCLSKLFKHVHQNDRISSTQPVRISTAL